MIIIDPVAMGDAACTRASPKWVFDRTGTLVEVPANTLGVTYDPTDLSKAPYALIEPADQNVLTNSEDFTHVDWGKSNVTPVPGSGRAPDGSTSATLLQEAAGVVGNYLTRSPVVNAGDLITLSVFARRGVGDRGLALVLHSAPVGTNQIVAFNLVSGEGSVVAGAPTFKIVQAGEFFRCSITFQAIASGNVGLQIRNTKDGSINHAGDGQSGVLVWGAMLSFGPASSYIRAGSAFATRAADVISATAGLIYSNVPMVEPPYSADTTYAKDAAVYDPVTKIVYWSMQASNLGKPLSDPAWWNKRTAINRWAMLDDRNDTQTEANEDILIVLSARAITQGLYLGNLDANEIRIAMTDQKRGLVYTETRSQVVSRSMASFYRWAFKRIRRRSYFLTLKLPVYANALVTILIRRPGGVAKCGMCMLGPATDVGLSHYGLSTELKDFSDTSFNPDGTSKTVVRGYAKRMSVDVEVDNQEIDDVEEELIAFRQKVVVYVGTVLFGSAMLVGKFSSLKKVIPGLRKSRLSLQVEGVVTK